MNGYGASRGHDFASSDYNYNPMRGYSDRTDRNDFGALHYQSRHDVHPQTHRNRPHHPHHHTPHHSVSNGGHVSSSLHSNGVSNSGGNNFRSPYHQLLNDASRLSQPDLTRTRPPPQHLTTPQKTRNRNHHHNRSRAAASSSSDEEDNHNHAQGWNFGAMFKSAWNKIRGTPSKTNATQSRTANATAIAMPDTVHEHHEHHDASMPCNPYLQTNHIHTAEHVNAASFPASLHPACALNVNESNIGSQQREPLSQETQSIGTAPATPPTRLSLGNLLQSRQTSSSLLQSLDDDNKTANTGNTTGTGGQSAVIGIHNLLQNTTLSPHDAQWLKAKIDQSTSLRSAAAAAAAAAARGVSGLGRAGSAQVLVQNLAFDETATANSNDSQLQPLQAPQQQLQHPLPVTASMQSRVSSRLNRIPGSIPSHRRYAPHPGLYHIASNNSNGNQNGAAAATTAAAVVAPPTARSYLRRKRARMDVFAFDEDEEYDDDFQYKEQQRKRMRMAASTTSGGGIIQNNGNSHRRGAFRDKYLRSRRTYQPPRYMTPQISKTKAVSPTAKRAGSVQRLPSMFDDIEQDFGYDDAGDHNHDHNNTHNHNHNHNHNQNNGSRRRVVDINDIAEEDAETKPHTPETTNTSPVFAATKVEAPKQEANTEGFAFANHVEPAAAAAADDDECAMYAAPTTTTMTTMALDAAVADNEDNKPLQKKKSRKTPQNVRKTQGVFGRSPLQHTHSNANSKNRNHNRMALQDDENDENDENGNDENDDEVDDVGKKENEELRMRDGDEEDEDEDLKKQNKNASLSPELKRKHHDHETPISAAFKKTSRLIASDGLHTTTTTTTTADENDENMNLDMENAVPKSPKMRSVTPPTHNVPSPPKKIPTPPPAAATNAAVTVVAGDDDDDDEGKQNKQAGEDAEVAAKAPQGNYLLKVMAQRKERYLNRYRQRLQRIYTEFQASKVDNVQGFLDKYGTYADTLHDLYCKVCAKYKLQACPLYEGQTIDEGKLPDGTLRDRGSDDTEKEKEIADVEAPPANASSATATGGESTISSGFKFNATSVPTTTTTTGEKTESNSFTATSSFSFSNAAVGENMFAIKETTDTQKHAGAVAAEEKKQDTDTNSAATAAAPQWSFAFDKSAAATQPAETKPNPVGWDSAVNPFDAKPTEKTADKQKQETTNGGFSWTGATTNGNTTTGAAAAAATNDQPATFTLPNNFSFATNATNTNGAATAAVNGNNTAAGTSNAFASTNSSFQFNLNGNSDHSKPAQPSAGDKKKTDFAWPPSKYPANTNDKNNNSASQFSLGFGPAKPATAAPPTTPLKPNNGSAFASNTKFSPFSWDKKNGKEKKSVFDSTNAMDVNNNNNSKDSNTNGAVWSLNGTQSKPQGNGWNTNNNNNNNPTTTNNNSNGNGWPNTNNTTNNGWPNTQPDKNTNTTNGGGWASNGNGNGTSNNASQSAFAATSANNGWKFGGSSDQPQQQQNGGANSNTSWGTGFGQNGSAGNGMNGGSGMNMNSNNNNNNSGANGGFKFKPSGRQNTNVTSQDFFAPKRKVFRAKRTNK